MPIFYVFIHWRCRKSSCMWVIFNRFSLSFQQFKPLKNQSTSQTFITVKLFQQSMGFCSSLHNFQQARVFLNGHVVLSKHSAFFWWMANIGQARWPTPNWATSRRFHSRNGKEDVTWLSNVALGVHTWVFVWNMFSLVIF